MTGGAQFNPDATKAPFRIKRRYEHQLRKAPSSSALRVTCARKFNVCGCPGEGGQGLFGGFSARWVSPGSPEASRGLQRPPEASQRLQEKLPHLISPYGAIRSRFSPFSMLFWLDELAVEA